jgi:peptidylprolyl isomerase
VFNPEDSTELAILKGERGEILIEELRDELLSLSNAASLCNTTCLFAKQKNALLALGYLGELLVKEYPYQVPSRGRFSFLPRLLGRCKVTFRMKRAGAILGNITIMADGYIAPITAGNFVDLSLRNFYTGLALKSVNKKFGNLSEQVAAPINVLGSYNEGFYDPLTAKLREIPLEIIRLERGSGQPKLSYSTRGFSDTSRSVDMPGEASSIPSLNSKPLLTFGAPGLIAFHHPDKNPNGGSSEFFGLQPDTMPEGKNALLDGDYAPFGFMIDGYDIFSSLDPDDVIDATFVDGFGQLNLVKIRESSFKEAAQGSEVETS